MEEKVLNAEGLPEAVKKSSQIAGALKTPLVLDFKENSLDDGPGIRTVVFFKGCPLSCQWCHNPESHKKGPEIAFDPALCVNCGACREVCPKKALSSENPLYIDRNKCDLCFLCTGACPSGALERVGKKMTIEQIVSRILPDKPFFEASGGGVTLSGGEPMLYMEFSSLLLKKLKSLNIHTLVETCGYFDLPKFVELIFPWVDAIYYDLKIINSEQHQRFCGLPNEKILENFAQLAKITAGTKKVLLPRTPLIPGITDTTKNIKALAHHLKNLGLERAALLPYNPLWHEKCQKLGKEDRLKNDPALATFSAPRVMKRCRNIFKKEGLSVFEE